MEKTNAAPGMLRPPEPAPSALEFTLEESRGRRSLGASIREIEERAAIATARTASQERGRSRRER